MKLTKVRKADPGAEHLVPLSRQAVAVLRVLFMLTGGGELLFPGRRIGRPIGEGAIGELYDAAGYAGRHVPHGWRASFSTILNDVCPADRSLIDQALAHAGAKGRVEAAYNRSQQLERMATCSSAGPISSSPTVPGEAGTLIGKLVRILPRSLSGSQPGAAGPCSRGAVRGAGGALRRLGEDQAVK
jgi:hypothetical protein